MTSTAKRSIAFLKRFVRDPRTVGAVCPSSSKLAAAMLRGFELRLDDTVVEYGPGTGAFTGLIREHQRKAGGGEYLGIERDEAFFDHLRHSHPELAFAHGSVEDVRQYLDLAGLQRPRLIVSGLPLILMPVPTMEHIVRVTAEILRPGGSFRTFSYLHSWPAKNTRRLRALMREHFDRFEMSRVVWWNCPPAFVLSGDRDDANSHVLRDSLRIA